MKMKLIDDILNDLKENYKDERVRDVRVGITWTAVLSRNLGLGYTFTGQRENGVHDVGKLTERTVFELADYLKSWNLTEASIGAAAINSILEPEGKLCENFDALRNLTEIGKGKNIAMVGHFPHTEEIRSAAKNLWIIEKTPRQGDFPAEAADYLIPKADVAVITGTTLINKSMERLLDLCKENDVYTIILGPSTVMSPVFFDRGADMLAGCRVINALAVLKKVSEGVGLVKEFKCDLEFVAMEK